MSSTPEPLGPFDIYADWTHLGKRFVSLRSCDDAACEISHAFIAAGVAAVPAEPPPPHRELTDSEEAAEAATWD